ncbi:MAG: phosphomannomutase/phosphoglucomutase [Armatimonadetes bacterium]|nr:phosphomannomutase/phosphoglucomutase [Armatimonadota bacterium]
MRSIFKACDVRGVYGRELTDEAVRRIGAAMATMIRRRGQEARVVVGGDVRLSTPSLKAALLEGLTRCGAECVDLGIVPTPVFYFARRHLGIAAGVMVTASHNPAPHNGLKLVLGDLPITAEELAALRALAEAGEGDTGSGRVEDARVLDAYCRFVMRATAGWHPHPRASAPRIVVDPGNGAWARLAAPLLRVAGYPVIAINDEPDGRFPGRDPNPAIAEHLSGLCERVRAEGAALGIAFDGDGDRVAFVDERGSPVTTDEAAMLLVRALVPGEPGARVAHDIKCSQAIADEVRRLGGVPLMERSGHTFLKARMIREGALLGPEASGHYFFRALGGGDDGLYCAFLMAGIVGRSRQALSEMVDALPHYAITPDIRVRFTGDPAPLLAAIAAAFPPEQVSRLDGVRVQFPDGWGLARPSVTEAALTLRFEGRTPEALHRIREAFLAPAPALREHLPPPAVPRARSVPWEPPTRNRKVRVQDV